MELLSANQTRGTRSDNKQKIEPSRAYYTLVDPPGLTLLLLAIHPDQFVCVSAALIRSFPADIVLRSVYVVALCQLMST